MLDRTFVHCPGVGPATERRLWDAGLDTWDAYLEGREGVRLGPRLRQLLDPLVCESRARLEAGDYAWFAEALPAREHWRAWPAFRNRAAFLDIETTGSAEWDSTTVVGIYDGERLRQFVRGDSIRDFADALVDRAILITFFGTGFDLPFLQREFGTRFPQLHIDLCFLLKRLGYSGGLKRVENALGLHRAPETEGLSGWDAVRLWWMWQNQDDGHALDRLLAYNAEDVLNLATLLDIAYPLMLARTLG